MSSRPVWAKIKLFGSLSSYHVAQVLMWMRKPILRDQAGKVQTKTLCLFWAMWGVCFFSD